MRFFEGFPYIVTKVVGAMHHIILLPGDFADNNLLEITRWQATANRLETCLVFSDHRCVYFESSGTESTAEFMYIMGDSTKGGREATPAEVRKLAGRNQGGVPAGLKKCAECYYWIGECIDPNPTFAGMIMRVYCRCQNDTLCARCGWPLYSWRLNANFYDPHDGQIWHVPGFSGFNHRCPPGLVAEKQHELEQRLRESSGVR